MLTQNYKALLADNARLTAALAQAQEALAFYADETKWFSQSIARTAVDQDRGKRARAVLEDPTAQQAQEPEGNPALRIATDAGHAIVRDGYDGSWHCTLCDHHYPGPWAFNFRCSRPQRAQVAGRKDTCAKCGAGYEPMAPGHCFACDDHPNHFTKMDAVCEAAAYWLKARTEQAVARLACTVAEWEWEKGTSLGVKAEVARPSDKPTIAVNAPRGCDCPGCKRQWKDWCRAE